MKTKKLIPMVQFVIERAKNAPLEPYHEVNENFVNDVVDYATFLDSKITYEMFEGEKRIFECGKYINRQPSTSFNTYEVNDVVLFADTNTQRNVSRGLKVNDLTTLGIFYNER